MCLRFLHSKSISHPRGVTTFHVLYMFETLFAYAFTCLRRKKNITRKLLRPYAKREVFWKLVRTILEIFSCLFKKYYIYTTFF